MLLKNIADKRYLFYIAIGMIDLLSFHFIVVLSCLSINIQYVQKLMNEINEDFRVNRGNYGWLLVIFFLDLIFLFYYTTITLYMFMFKENSMFGWKWKDFELGYSKLNCFKKKNDPNNDPNNDPSNTTNGGNNSGNDDTNTSDDNGGNNDSKSVLTTVVPKTWDIDRDFEGNYTWTDGENVYLSLGNYNYILDKETSTWNKKTWNGYSYILGDKIWTDGNNIYLSNNQYQYVLDKSTSTWNKKTWSGLNSFDGSQIWNDGENIYYSQGSNQYVLNKETLTWETKLWTGENPTRGDIWTDGNDIYYSHGTEQYVLDKATSTWNRKTWNGLSNPEGIHIWTYKGNIYYSEDSVANGTSMSQSIHRQYILDKETSTWIEKTWNGYTSFDGMYIWNDEENVYYSNGTSQYTFVSED